MNKFTLCLFFTIAPFNLFSQDCNRTTLVERLASTIPPGICIPSGYLIDEIYKPTDVNGDQFPEFVFSWRKTSLNDGDTIFISFYKNNEGRGFTHLKTLANLFPIFFRSYQASYTSYDQSLTNIFERYNGFNPLQDLLISENRIEIKIERSAGEGLIFTYEFLNNDWSLKELKEWEYDRDQNFSSKLVKITNVELSITKFNYFDHMY